MKTSASRILTTHVGSMPRPESIKAMLRARLAGQAVDEARQPLVGIGEKARLAHLAVGDDVDTDPSLLAHGIGDGFLHVSRELSIVHRLAGQSGPEQGLDALRPRHAADVRGEDAARAALHRQYHFSLSTTLSNG